MAGKVLIPIAEHINRLLATRLQFDIMGVDTIIVARTDAEAATLITSTIDTRDHPFILGSTNSRLKPLSVIISEAYDKGITGAELQALEDKWVQDADIKLYSEAVSDALKAAGKSNLVPEFTRKCSGFSFDDSKVLARSMGVDPYWCWNASRVREGFYRYQGGTLACVARGSAYAKYADLIWMETKKPIYKVSRSEWLFRLKNFSLEICIFVKPHYSFYYLPILTLASKRIR